MHPRFSPVCRVRRVLPTLLAIAAVLGATACQPTPPTPTPVTVNPGPTAAPPAAASCADVCAHLAVLGCPAAKPSPGGSPCAVVCENIQASGIISWNLACRAAAPSCQAADRCETGP